MLLLHEIQAKANQNFSSLDVSSRVDHFFVAPIGNISGITGKQFIIYNDTVNKANIKGTDCSTRS